MLYTSDGRDVEMSVASTKAFYAQVAAGVLLAVALADAVNGELPVNPRLHERRQQLLTSLRELPAAMADVLNLHDRIADIVRRHALGRTYWAVVGNGLNRVAAEEVRIKLSELCYKSIACDTTEDKKHIDLSSEPLILVCAAGLFDSTADDVAKEVAIFRAHKAAPIVITSGTEARFDAAAEVIATPTTAYPELAFVLTTMVGHLFGYESALAIDELAQPLRETRAAIESEVANSNTDIDAGTDSQQLLERLRSQFTPAAQQFFQDLRQGRYNGCLEAGTAAEMASMYRYALDRSLCAYQLERGQWDHRVVLRLPPAHVAVGGDPTGRRPHSPDRTVDFGEESSECLVRSSSTPPPRDRSVTNVRTLPPRSRWRSPGIPLRHQRRPGGPQHHHPCDRPGRHHCGTGLSHRTRPHLAGQQAPRGRRATGSSGAGPLRW